MRGPSKDRPSPAPDRPGPPDPRQPYATECKHPARFLTSPRYLRGAAGAGHAGASGCDEAPQLHLNGLDFCAAIRNAAMLPPSPQHVHTRREDAPDQIAGNVAYAMAMVDPQEPAHGTASVAFQSPRRDKVVAVGFDQLWTRLRCGEYYAAATYAHPNIAAAARLVTPAMHNYAKQLDIMVSLGRAKVDLTNAALLDASGELVVTSAQTLDTVSEMLQTYSGWSWRAVLATTSIGTAVGGVIAAGIAVASAHVYLASAESAHAHFTAAFPMRAEQVERELVANARRADIVGATPEPVARTVAQGFDYSD